jgi:hypothetical protein
VGTLPIAVRHGLLIFLHKTTVHCNIYCTVGGEQFTRPVSIRHDALVRGCKQYHWYVVV